MLALEPSSSWPANGALGTGDSPAPPQFVVPARIWIARFPNGGRLTSGLVQTSASVVVVVLVVGVVVSVVVETVVAVLPLATKICALPWSPIAPGPGRSATPSTAPFPVAGMQKTAPSDAG